MVINKNKQREVSRNKPVVKLKPKYKKKSKKK